MPYLSHLRYLVLGIVYLTMMFSFPQVNPSMVPALANWQNKFSIQVILQSIRQLMMEGPNKKLTQPPEGSVYEQR